MGVCEGRKNPDNMTFDFSKQAVDDLRNRIKDATLHFIAQSCNGKVLNACSVPAFKDNMLVRYSNEDGGYSPLFQLNCDAISEVLRKSALKVAQKKN